MTPPVSDEEMQRTLAAYFAHSGNTTRMADDLGLSRNAVQTRVKRLHRDGYIREAQQTAQLDYTPDIDGSTVNIDAKPRVRVRAYNVSVTRDLPVRRVLAIGDTHWKPGQGVDHMRWIGRHVAEARPDNVIHIGDALDMGSCEFHSAPGSASQITRPSFQDEIAAGEDALEAYHAEIGLGEVPHDVVYGNHEFRVERIEELAPNLAGTLTLQRDQMFARYRWKTTPYRHWLFFEGVGFTHVPHSIMQKPIGGRYPENTIGNQSTHSVVFGHTHRWNHVTVPKIGINNAITVTNVGCAMPHGYLPSYTDGATTGYTYGIAELRLRGGRVEGANFISMLDLESRYA